MTGRIKGTDAGKRGREGGRGGPRGTLDERRMEKTGDAAETKNARSDSVGVMSLVLRGLI